MAKNLTNGRKNTNGEVIILTQEDFDKLNDVEKHYVIFKIVMQEIANGVMINIDKQFYNMGLMPMYHKYIVEGGLK